MTVIISISADHQQVLRLINGYGDAGKVRYTAALDEAAELGITAIAAHTPVVTGALKSATQRIRSGFYSRTIANSRDYALPVEHGAKAHTITARNAKVLVSRDGRVFGRSVRHPGSTGRRMFERGSKTVEQNIGSIFERHFSR